MSSKDNNIIKRKDGTFEAKYIKDIINNNIIYGYIIGNSKKEVKKRLKYSRKYELNFNIYKIPVIKNKEYLQSFNYKIDKWLEFKKNKVKESTYTTYLYIVETRIRSQIGYIKIKKLSKEIINSYLEELKNNTDLSINSIHDIAIIIKQILKYHKIVIDFNVPPKMQKEIVVFTKEEIKIIKKRALTYNNRCDFGIILCLYMGLRIGELCALKKESFDLDNYTITVSHTILRIKNVNKSRNYKTKLIITNPKSKTSLRTIPIPDILKKYVKFYVINMNTGNYFLTNSHVAMEPRCYTNHYKRFLKYWGINNKKFHTTRHTFATNADEACMSTKALSEVLGHSSANITQNLYIHPSLNYKRVCMNNVYNKKTD